MNNDKAQLDIKENKVKQGSLMKQSRHIKQWKERWMVLTKTHFYSFEDKNQTKNPTEVVALKDIETTKSYYKDQYKRPYTFRVQSPDVNLHFSARSSDEKWAWMTAIQKMIERAIHPEDKPDIQNEIKETIKMSTAVRQTLQKNEQRERKKSIDYSGNILKRLKIGVCHKTTDFHYIPDKPKIERQQSSNSEIVQAQTQKKEVEVREVIVQKIVEKIVQVQRIVEKIVKVPEIETKIVQKQKQNSSYEQKVGEKSSFAGVLKKITANHTSNPKPLVNFVVFLLTSEIEQFQPQTLQYCFDPESMRFFAQVFLLMMNQQTSEQILNTYLKFVIVLYQNCNEYFYSSDLKALVGILLRQMEMNRSEFSQYLILSLLNELTNKEWWVGLNERRNQLITFIKEIEAISDINNKELASEVLKKI